MNDKEFEKLMEIGEALGYPKLTDAERAMQKQVWDDEGATFTKIKKALENETNIKNISNVQAKIQDEDRSRRNAILIAKIAKEIFGLDVDVMNSRTGEVDFSTVKNKTSTGEKISPIFKNKTPEAPVDVDWDAELKRIIN